MLRLLTMKQKGNNMKIIKTKEQVDALRLNKEKANEGCDRCPCCGKKYGLNGLLLPMSKTWCTGFFKTRHYKIDTYICSSCGAVWESDPYEYEY